MTKEIDRRIIFLVVALALSVPLVLGYTVRPAQLRYADTLYDIVDSLQTEEGKFAFVAMDFGPNTKAENKAQAEVIVEHLMRKRIPVAVFSMYALAEPFLDTLPREIANKLNDEGMQPPLEYGSSWVNLGYRPGASIFLQSIPKSENIVELFKNDVYGNRLSDLPAIRDARTIEDIQFLGEFTGLVGMFNRYIQFFQSENYRPQFGHGCTSITIPEAFIYLDSKQLDGLLEGIAGAAWYSQRLSEEYSNRVPDRSIAINTGLGIAHLVVILFIVLGNVIAFSTRGGKP